ncbi:MAG: FG-GAP-like repeat-containing protein [Candidatus Neomarinimicrobiota bacterium]
MDWAASMFNPAATEESAIIPEIDDAYGVAFKDLTNDGLPDLYVVRFRELNRLFINRGPGKSFYDRTIRSGLGGNLSSRGRKNLELGASVVDFDNDGRQDVLIAGWDRTTRLFRGGGRLTYDEVTDEAGIERPLSGNCAIWSDIDRDGDLDLFVTDEHGENHLFIQNRPGRFENRAREYGIADEQISQGASFGDLDGDGFPDLYVCNWFAPDVLYRNQGGKLFQRIDLPLPHLTDPLRSNGVWMADVDNDGDLDLLVTDRQRTTRLYRNDLMAENRKWLFTDITAASGLINRYPCYSGLIADLNNDGWQDVFFANIGPNLLFLNQGAAGFVPVYQQEIPPGSHLEHYSTGAAVADYDNDGDLDLFVSNKDTLSNLFSNPGTAGHSIRVALSGSHSNRDGIGGKIWLEKRLPGETWNSSGYREISGGQGYLSIGEGVAHFGGISDDGIYRVRIVFPSGKEIIKDNVHPGTVIVIAESAGPAHWFFTGLRAARRLVAQPDFWNNFLLVTVLALVLSGFVIVAVRRYRWSNRQTAGFVGGTLFFLMLWLGLLPEYGLRPILWGQLVLLLIEISAVTGFSERIRQLSLRRYGYRQVLRHFSEQLILIRDNADLYRELVDTIQTTLATRFCILLAMNEGKTRPGAMAGTVPAGLEIIEFSDRQHGQLLAETVIDPRLSQRFERLAERRVARLIPIRRNCVLLAVLILGKRINDLDYQSEDSDVLTILAGQAALAIENNRYIEEARQLTEKIIEARTREKYVAELEEKNRVLKELYQDLQQTQAQLIQSEKMSSLGQLVAGVAHELNNPIGFIYANMHELRKYIADLNDLTNGERQLAFDQNDVRQLIDESVEGSRRVKEIVENLRNFSRLDEAEFKAVNIHEGLNATLMLLGNELKGRIAVHKNYGDLPEIECLPGYLNQVFMNLLLNAIQAIAGQGNIWVETSRRESDLVISIRDDGRGIPTEVRSKIFDPFFTTKPVGQGTGLGLSISYGIIERHGGSIAVDSTPDKGTVFIITIPIKQQRNQTDE